MSGHLERIRCRRWWALTLVGALVCQGVARADGELRQELSEAAHTIANQLHQHGEDAIALGQFTGPPNYPTSSGPGITQILAEELQKLGINVKKRAKLGIQGEYRATEKRSDEFGGAKLLAVSLRGSVEDAFNNPLPDARFERTVASEAAFVELFGTPVVLPAQETPEQRSRELRKSYTQPRSCCAGTLVQAQPGSPYAVEILIDGKPREAREQEGLAYIALNRDETYAVRLINNSDRDAAAELTIDGLNMFAFTQERHADGPQKGEPLYSVVLIPAHQDLLIKGWHRTNDVSTSFRVTGYADGVPVGPPATDLGTITATFAAAWPEDQPPPSDEPAKRKGVSGNRTGFGPPVDAHFNVVKRRVGVLRASVSVRYTK